MGFSFTLSDWNEGDFASQQKLLKKRIAGLMNWSNRSNGSWNKYAFQSVNNSAYLVNKQRFRKSIFLTKKRLTI